MRDRRFCSPAGPTSERAILVDRWSVQPRRNLEGRRHCAGDGAERAPWFPRRHHGHEKARLATTPSPGVRAAMVRWISGVAGRWPRRSSLDRATRRKRSASSSLGEVAAQTIGDLLADLDVTRAPSIPRRPSSAAELAPASVTTICEAIDRPRVILAEAHLLGAGARRKLRDRDEPHRGPSARHARTCPGARALLAEWRIWRSPRRAVPPTWWRPVARCRGEAAVCTPIYDRLRCPVSGAASACSSRGVH